MRPRQRPSGSETLSAFADKSANAEVEQRASDLYALSQLLDSPDIKPDETDAFVDMQTRLARGRYPLTDKQRKWVLSRCEELGVDPNKRSHEERNANVPRGRDVATPAVLQSLPKSPPGRSPPCGYGGGALRSLDQDRRAVLERQLRMQETLAETALAPSIRARHEAQAKELRDSIDFIRARSQLDRALAVLTAMGLRGSADPTFGNAVRDLRDILADAQNSPPQGGSDESFSTKQWDALRVLIDMLQVVQPYVDVLMGKDPECHLPIHDDAYGRVEEDDLPF